MNWIRLTKNDGRPVWVNMARATEVEPRVEPLTDTKTKTVISFGDEYWVFVKEDAEHVIRMSDNE
jgi:hypothetical protein